jgi:hypothetical protein
VGAAGSFILGAMAVPFKRGLLLFAICVVALPVRADEITLKDGKKFYGVIVAYDNNMFKVKTDFGYVLVEKSKIASIIPMASETDGKAAAKKQTRPEGSNPEQEPVKAGGADAQPMAEPAVVSTTEKPAPKISNAAVRPELPANGPKANAVAPAIKGTPSASTMALATPLAPPPPEAEAPAVREEVQGNVYTNYTHGFRMYKAPSWQLIDDARTALPNAIVAMGTFNESTLMVVGQEKTKQPLDAAATTVEKRLREVYDNYRQTSQQKTVVGGLPAVEYRYRGKADEHDWSGTLVVIARGNDIFTALGMTYADTDLIQIQENVIAKAITSLDFNVR